ncbi:hypothetical protein FSP39_021442 [Pinctada imbricata]|uniref:5'-nucleotidase n=1 Tax=Pinctada imbricata TaxID=66713 RepID=A0AA89BMD4_PINIB|nr:hypothetical protein FSP39_021442 [Pinctada imbricata]
MPQELTIIHFNDVYNIEPQKNEPVGGAARFTAYVKSQQSHNPLILFSGDVLNPSLMSIFMKGEQMVPVMNAIGVHCAVFGNHDFDFGVDHLEEVMEDTKFPWLMSNVVDNLTGEMLGNGKVSYMVEWSGYKIGLMGLVEEEWIETLATLDPEDVTFQDYVVKGTEIAKQLRDEGADIVIALTHMRWPNDRRLAKEVEGIDLILGGHDHDYGLEKVNDRYIVKSGTDFQNLSKVRVCMNNTGVDVNIERVDLTSDFPEDPGVLDVVKHLQKDIDSKMEEHLGNMQVELDGRFSAVRTGETNLGNFITDIMLEITNAEVALLNSGTLRSNRIHPKGEFKLRDLLTILPLVDELLVIQCTGEQILEALENGVSQYPNFDGRFPQVAGIEFGFDPSMPKGKRVEPGLVKIQDHYIDLKRNYRLCTKEYIAQGKDGYEVFKKCPVVVGDVYKTFSVLSMQLTLETG